MTETYRASSAEQGDQTGLDNILVDTNTPDLFLAAGCRALDVRSGLDILVRTDRVLLVVKNIQVNTQTRQGVGQRREGTRTNTGDAVLAAVDLDDTSETTLEVLGVSLCSSHNFNR